MELLIALVVIIAVPIGLLLWTRRNRNADEPRTDPDAARQPGAPLNSPREDQPRDYGAGSTL